MRNVRGVDQKKLCLVVQSSRLSQTSRRTWVACHRSLEKTWCWVHSTLTPLSGNRGQ